MYANDVILLKSISREGDVIRLEFDLNSFNDWCYIKLMELNFKNGIYFCRYSKLYNEEYISDSKLSKLESFIDLQVNFNQKLEFNNHICNKCSQQASCGLSFIKGWSTEFDDPYVTKKLFNTFGHPHSKSKMKFR